MVLIDPLKDIIVDNNNVEDLFLFDIFHKGPGDLTVFI